MCRNGSCLLAYFDVWVLIVISRLKAATHVLKSNIQALGLSVNFQKSLITPSQQFLFSDWKCALFSFDHLSDHRVAVSPQPCSISFTHSAHCCNSQHCGTVLTSCPLESHRRSFSGREPRVREWRLHLLRLRSVMVQRGRSCPQLSLQSQHTLPSILFHNRLQSTPRHGCTSSPMAHHTLY